MANQLAQNQINTFEQINNICAKTRDKLLSENQLDLGDSCISVIKQNEHIATIEAHTNGTAFGYEVFNSVYFDNMLLFDLSVENNEYHTRGEFNTLQDAVEYLSKQFSGTQLNAEYPPISIRFHDTISDTIRENHPDVNISDYNIHQNTYNGFSQNSVSSFFVKLNQNERLEYFQKELANATEALDNMRDFMPAQPTSEYLNQMQEAALRVEKLQKEINSIKGDLPLQAKTNTSISKFSISPLPQPINGSVAVCSATFYNMLTVNGITITNGRNGLYVKMPQKRTKQGGYIDVAHPLSADGRRNINQTLLSAYREGIFKQEFEVPQPKEIAAQNSVKYPPEYGNSLARMDLVVDDMVVHNVKIIKGNDEKLHFSMPGYKAKDGNYTSICNPASKDAFAKFSQASLEEYKTDYSFRKLSDDDVAALRESGIKLQCRKNAQGENVVKFKFEDLAKVNAVVNPTPTAAPKIQ